MSHSSGKACCIFRSCTSRSTDGVALFRLHKDINRSSVWLKGCNREDLLEKTGEELYRNYRICEKHFESSYITKGIRKRLFDDAFPTIFSHSTAKPPNKPYQEPKKICIVSDILILPAASKPEVVNENEGPISMLYRYIIKLI
ncbi:hypothetical protein NQ315_003695 [Exocentrus adspersus]|uniref:THAP-type domain-containing protein n=1 Tax=Exocentrus adspersus TaxID=1586481 RepID=A0AAV8V711_9CUCU|nr:hypothetical protein NQ315_003695 [Exocentrus adspersus]